MKNLFVCIIMSENNNKLYLLYFLMHIAFLRVFFIKELAGSVTNFLTRQEIM